MIKKLWIFIIPLIILSPGCKVNRDAAGFAGVPVLISPENNSIVSENPPTFTWQVVSGNRHYQILLTTDDSKSRFVRLVSVAYDATTVSYTHGSVLSSGVYTWMVRWVRDIDT